MIWNGGDGNRVVMVNQVILRWFVATFSIDSIFAFFRLQFFSSSVANAENDFLENCKTCLAVWSVCWSFVFCVLVRSSPFDFILLVRLLQSIYPLCSFTSIRYDYYNRQVAQNSTMQSKWTNVHRASTFTKRVKQLYFSFCYSFLSIFIILYAYYIGRFVSFLLLIA